MTLKEELEKINGKEPTKYLISLKKRIIIKLALMDKKTYTLGDIINCRIDPIVYENYDYFNHRLKMVNNLLKANKEKLIKKNNKS